jgi:RNA polymerase sigma-70 factor (sigma-E family)
MESGDDESFAVFVMARRRALLKVAWLLTGEWHLAEDLLQTALAKTYVAWHRVDEPDAYVSRVLATTYATWWRRRWRGERPTAELPDRPDRDVYPDADLRHQLVDALRRLPRKQRAVVVLRFFEDLTEPETAAALGCSVGTVKSHMARAMVRLRGSAVLADLAPASSGGSDDIG